MTPARRFEFLGGPGGYMTALPAGDPRRHDRYHQWVTLAQVNRPLSPALVSAAKDWALRSFELVGPDGSRCRP